MRRDTNEKQQIKDSKRMKDSNQDKRSGKLFRICQLLSKIYSEL